MSRTATAYRTRAFRHRITNSAPRVGYKFPDLFTTLFPHTGSRTNSPAVSPLRGVQAHDLEEQLNKELKRDHKAVRSPRRVNTLASFHKEKIIEQDVIDAINQWETEKIGITKQESEYGSKVRAEIQKFLDVNAETMLKEDWVQKNQIIKRPAQILYGILRQGAQKPNARSSSKNVVEKSVKSSIAKVLNLQMYILTPTTNYRTRTAPTLQPLQATSRLRGSTTTNAVTDIEKLSKEDRKFLLHAEINMELVSIILKKLIEGKKRKQENIRLESSKLMRQVYEANQVFLVLILMLLLIGLQGENFAYK